MRFRRHRRPEAPAMGIHRQRLEAHDDSREAAIAAAHAYLARTPEALLIAFVHAGEEITVTRDDLCEAPA